ncbi:SAGA-associated factor 29-like protein [Pseudohyphozyma bogoriensis]|nr:SAGA-associated factor 29-like protein [Pseudohyphozyma bogoriensis]
MAARRARPDATPVPIVPAGSTRFFPNESEDILTNSVQTDIPQLTNQLRAQMREYATYAGQVNSTLKDANQIQSELEEKKPLSLLKGRLDKVYSEIEVETVEELRKIEKALETLDRLLDLQNVPEAAPSPAPSSTAPPGPNKRGPYKKKNKTGDASAAPSPAASAAPSPAAAIPHGSPSTANVPLPRTSAKPLTPAPIAPAGSQGSPAPSAVGTPTTAKHGKSTAKHRKQLLEGQLPLSVGRMVAFKNPNTPPGDPEEWILARVVACIQGDKNRYTVEDVDYEPQHANDDKGRFNTTLKSIIPLPDPEDRARTYPAQPFPPNTAVMALYPDTTSFYSARVQSGPQAAAHVEKGKTPQLVYMVKFDDDDDLMRSAPVELVVEISGSKS